MSHDPKLRPHVPLTPDPKFIGGARAMSLDSPHARSLLWVGRVLHVDVETMVCSIALATGTGERVDVPIPQFAGGGPRSGALTLPEKNSVVIIGWRQYSNRGYAPYIVQTATVGVFPARDYEPFSTVDPAEAAAALEAFPDLARDPHVNMGVVRLKSRKAYAGEFVAYSAQGAEALLDRDARVANRAGNEFFLRDADQTAVLQTVSYFESSAAGYYRRGLIRRNAFNLQPDLAISGFVPSEDDYDAFIDGKFATLEDDDGNPMRTLVVKVAEDSPAYEKLSEFGLINSDGTPVEAVGSDPGAAFYPFVVLPDGQRASYVVQGEHSASFAETDQCYVEDRADIRHTSDGVMDVTEDGDGVQIDQVPPIFIEDVKGTVVGNDPYTEPGRALYKRIMTMRVFDDPDQGSNSPAPIFEPVDTVTSQEEADTKALARLFRMQSPTGSNQFAYGVTKEGRLFLHVPKSRTGTPQEKGKSIDANILGLVKAVIGSDENTRTSVDLRALGGVKLDIGAFQDRSDPESPQNVSVDLVLRGKIRTQYAGTQGRENIVGGSDFTSVTGSKMDVVGGNCVRSVGGAEAVEATSITHNVGAGGYKLKSAGDVDNTFLGKTTEHYGGDRQVTFATPANDLKTVSLGVDSTTVLSGSISRTVSAGAGISDTVTTGNLTQTVGTGNMTVSVATGSLSATVGSGSLSLTAGAGAATLTGVSAVTVSSSAAANITAPVVKIGASVAGSAVAGVPGPPGPHVDFLTGRPILGVPTITIG